MFFKLIKVRLLVSELYIQEFMCNVPNNDVLLENWANLVTKYSKNFIHVLICVAFGGSWKYLQRTVK